MKKIRLGIMQAFLVLSIGLIDGQQNVALAEHRHNWSGHEIYDCHTPGNCPGNGSWWDQTLGALKTLWDALDEALS